MCCCAALQFPKPLDSLYTYAMRHKCRRCSCGVAVTLLVVTFVFHHTIPLICHTHQHMFDTKVCKNSSPRIARALIALMRTSCFTTAPWSASLIMTSLKPSASSSRRRFSRQKARFPAVCKALLFTSSAPLRVSSYTAQGHSFMPCTEDYKRITLDWCGFVPIVCFTAPKKSSSDSRFV